jgi:hypothetical protein
VSALSRASGWSAPRRSRVLGGVEDGLARLRAIVEGAAASARRGVPLGELYERVDALADSMFEDLARRYRCEPRRLAIALRELHEVIATATTVIAARYAEASV